MTLLLKTSAVENDRARIKQQACEVTLQSLLEIICTEQVCVFILKLNLKLLLPSE
jgi:hypothetical protein